ncbi:uncharacterized protein PITG_14021 [Phytophthora infestans T30-4]|uniref:Spindle pole body component n=1 Tax=Phytophthora infestans (strain T30-4) TaxID=403677 RepID=D0NNC3_PHYIT|nr:uncharacterized protein PITG_14021 [Phytophthora infestans T30-4]EEY62030.1 hypothetical protein PITG_14021 [Phytophthora infestans T30-4]|eukprot:XP_002899670.1 hypothetical protein PITG_14021 [Phytophthora infestans T30-4]
MRQVLLQSADMLHYTKSLLSYLTSQVSRKGWSKYRDTLKCSRRLAEMDATHEQYLDYLLNRFFLLDKHATVIQYILTTFNHILRFVRQVDAFVSAVPSVRLPEHPDFRVLQSEMARNAKEFKRQSHFLVVMLTAMQKHGASPHVNEIVTQLNYNYFYHQQETRSRPQPQDEQPRPVQQVSQAKAPALNRSGSLRPPPAPKKFSRTRSVQMS